MIPWRLRKHGGVNLLSIDPASCFYLYGEKRIEFTSPRITFY